MPGPTGRDFFEWEDAGGVTVVRFTTGVLRDDRIIRMLFEELEKLLEPYGLQPETRSKFERALALVDRRAPVEVPLHEPVRERTAPEPVPRRGRRGNDIGLRADEPMLEAGRKILHFHWEKALAHEGTSAEKHAKHFRDVVIPNMTTLRELGDELELMMPHELWPLATYREMLFIK